MGSTGSERRRHPRVATELPLQVTEPGGRAETIDLLDLSESGARVRCGRAMPAMTRVRVAMVLPGAAPGENGEARLTTEGVVVWCHATDEGGYDTGVFFPELGEPDRRRLRDFLRARA